MSSQDGISASYPLSQKALLRVMEAMSDFSRRAGDLIKTRKPCGSCGLRDPDAGHAAGCGACSVRSVMEA